eukprot:TRINITY_DN27011_c0_g1_i1.p1 TRINITY_DN27011_c0_g1~~TRINITY_DN27011_c0_g1_i1.p1  ORF type:complete len:178 (-),score=17.19 TRINITY_DN27011_c0_g1_i1:26-559(-)
MEPGLPALLILVVATVIGFIVGLVFRNSNTSGSDANYVNVEHTAVKRRGRVAGFACVVGIVALIFWIWAVLLSFTSHFDLGAVTFLVALAAASRGLCLRDQGGASDAKTFTCVILLSCLLVALNYGLGVLLCCFRVIEGEGLLIPYFVVGMCWWIAAGAIGNVLGRSLSEELLCDPV